MAVLLEAPSAPTPPQPPRAPHLPDAQVVGAAVQSAAADPRLTEEEAALKRLVLHRDGGDDVARLVIERVVPRLMAFLRFRYRSLAEDDAYDAAAEALRVAIERRAEFDPARASNVRTWLYGIAVIKAADALRKRGSVVPLDAESESSWGAEARAHRVSGGASLAAGVETVRRAEQIRETLLTLPPQQRKAALARYVDGLAPAEIDRQFGWKPNTAHVYLSVARKTIRKKLGDGDE